MKPSSNGFDTRKNPSALSDMPSRLRIFLGNSQYELRSHCGERVGEGLRVPPCLLQRSGP